MFPDAMSVRVFVYRSVFYRVAEFNDAAALECERIEQDDAIAVALHFPRELSQRVIADLA